MVVEKRKFALVKRIERDLKDMDVKCIEVVKEEGNPTSLYIMMIRKGDAVQRLLKFRSAYEREKAAVSWEQFTLTSTEPDVGSIQPMED